jgi:hypothetical protein
MSLYSPRYSCRTVSESRNRNSVSPIPFGNEVKQPGIFDVLYKKASLRGECAIFLDGLTSIRKSSAENVLHTERALELVSALTALIVEIKNG